MRRCIEVTIAELALCDLPFADGQRTASALASELARLLTDDDRPLAVDNQLTARASEMRLAKDEAPDRIGGRLAQVIHRHLRP